MTVFKADAHVPPLPLPELSETCAFLKELIRPLTPPEDYERASQAVDAFSVSGKPLQDMLRSYKNDLAGNGSWLRPFWDDSYLAWRGKLPMEMNYVLELRPERWGEKPLATFILAACRFFLRLGTEDLPVELARGVPLAMDSLRFMAYTRIPCPGRDILYRVPLSGSAHIAVVSHGCWFIMTVSDAAGVLASVDAVDKALGSIPELAARQDCCPPVGAMTSAKRDEAAAVRALLLEDEANRCALADIENCLFTISLDEAGANFGHDLLAGDSANRWFDKSLQVIASPDGRLGLNLEHAGCDAGCWTYALNWIDRTIREGAKEENDEPVPVTVRPVFWKTDQEAEKVLADMHALHHGNAAQLECVFRLFDMVNRNDVKALCCGPDAFAQLAYQTTYYRLTQEHASAYEAVSVRNFYQGRTECARPATLPALEFARMLSGDTVDTAALRSACTRADEEHRSRLERCQKGLGVERHLFGLSIMAHRRKGTEADSQPELFQDPALLAATRNTLSTSSVAGPSIRFFSFGPVLEDGLGIGYAMTMEGLQITVTSLPGSRTSAARFVAEMETVINLMMRHLSQK